MATVIFINKQKEIEAPIPFVWDCAAD